MNYITVYARLKQLTVSLFRQYNKKTDINFKISEEATLNLIFERMLMLKKTVGYVIADSMEYLPFTQVAKEYNGQTSIRRGNESTSIVLTDGKNELELIAVKCGVGKTNAASATAFLIADEKADYIINAGLSGGISSVRRGDIVAGSSYTECDFDLSPFGLKLGQKADGQPSVYFADETLLELVKQVDPDIKVGKLGTGDFFLSDTDKKENLKQIFDLTAFDMETGAIGSVCQKNNVPMLSIRKISDDAGDTSGDDYQEMNNRAEDHLAKIVIELCKKILAL